VEAAYGSGGYGKFKKDLAEVVVDTLAPVREKTEKILADEASLDRTLAHGAARAARVARQTMEMVRERSGFVPRTDP
ncbi:MAG TPA: tryptophan--tRNA ligase, partial [Streptosporangiaceae bacterium]|nr:tryptophan--tRNA ligase [Streptosporangiaceae bacterium]